KVVFTLPGEFDRPHPVTEGRAAFAGKDKWGYFDRQGKVVVEPKYDDVKKFSEGLAAVNLGAKSAGFPRPDIKRGGKWGFIDKTGRLVIPIEFSYVDMKGFSDGLALVSLQDKRAYIDKTGKVVIAPEYKSDDAKRFISSVGSFSAGLARVDTSGGYSGYS